MRSASPRRTQINAIVLLVDDNRDGVLARRSVLEELGYTVVPACCGTEALELADAQQFDLVITDFKMSPMNGLELISALRKRNFEKPIILLTGFAEALGLRPDTTGADVIIQKSANELQSLLRHTKRLLSPAGRKPPGSIGKPTRVRGSG